MSKELLHIGEIENDNELDARPDPLFAEKAIMFDPANYDIIGLKYDKKYATKKVTRISWDLGNPCTYACSYCPAINHDGSIQWPTLEHAKNVVRTITDHYKGMGRNLNWGFLGGEVIVWKDFLKFLEFIKEYDEDAYLSVTTNGKRTVNWWRKAKYFLNSVNFTVHIEYVDPYELREVVNEVYDELDGLSMQIPVIPSKWDECIEVMNILKEANGYNRINLKFLYNYHFPNTFRNKRNTTAGLPVANDPESRLGYVQIKDGKITTEKYTQKQIEIINTLAYNKHKHVGDGWQKYTPLGLYIWRKSDNTEHTIAWHQLLGYKVNRWKGWQCNAGIETLILDKYGYVESARCRVKRIGDWKTGLSNIQWPTKPLICPMEYCGCLFDVATTKIKI